MDNYFKYFDVEPGEYWLDLGANAGKVSSYILNQKGEVCAFEPVMYKQLCENLLKDYGFYGWVAYPFAVWNKNEKGEFFVGLEDCGDGVPFGESSIYHYKEVTDTLQIQRVDINGILLNPIDAIKMDIQGAEYEVIQAIQDFYWRRINKFVFEYHGIRGWKNMRENCLKILRNNFKNVEIEGMLVYCWK